LIATLTTLIVAVCSTPAKRSNHAQDRKKRRSSRY
jgi:hypothetical protein